MGFGIAIIPIIFLVLILLTSIKILNEYERAVVFRLGRAIGVKGPGLIILIPFIDKMQKVSLRTIVLDIQPQDIITRDNISVTVNAVLYFRVVNPSNAILDVDNYLYATNQLSQTTLRSICGESELDELLSEREKINHKLQSIIDEQTEPWGIKVTSVELKQIDLPEEMRRAMAKQAEAERERRSKIIHADGEFQAAKKLADAAEVIQRQPAALQLRYLQTLSDIAQENNSTIAFPVPIEMFQPFIDNFKNNVKVNKPIDDNA